MGWGGSRVVGARLDRNWREQQQQQVSRIGLNLPSKNYIFKSDFFLAMTIPSNLPFKCLYDSIDESTESKCSDVSIDELTVSKLLLNV